MTTDSLMTAYIHTLPEFEGSPFPLPLPLMVTPAMMPPEKLFLEIIVRTMRVMAGQARVDGQAGM